MTKRFMALAAMSANILLLAACHGRSDSEWTVTQTDLYRVDSATHGGAGCRAQALATHTPYFLIRTLVGSPDSPISRGVVQHEVRWCTDREQCLERAPELGISRPADEPEKDRSVAESGAECRIVRHRVVGDRITITSDSYAWRGFAPEQCEAARRGPLPEAFACTSRLTITGQRVRPDAVSRPDR